MFGLGPTEIVIVLIAGMLFFFGGDKIGEIARGFGRFTGEFKKGREEIEREVKKAEKEFKKSV